jgi:hypothetical protein
MTNEILKDRFSHHVPKNEKVTKSFEDIRRNMLTTACILGEKCPESRELNIAIKKLEEAMYWANAAIARNQDKVE